MTVAVVVRAGSDVVGPATLQRSDGRGFEPQGQLDDAAQHKAMARVAERGSFVRSEVVAVLRDARLEDVVGKTHGLGQRVGGLELNAVGKVLPGADE